MTWFQLIDAQREDPEPVRNDTKLAPNSAMFFNPTLPVDTAVDPKPSKGYPRLVKGSRVGSVDVPSAA